MPITDIVTRLDPVPEFTVARPTNRDGQSGVRDVKDSKYRKALSRSINDAAPQPSPSKEAPRSHQTPQSTETSPRPTSNPQDDVLPTGSASPKITDAPDSDAPAKTHQAKAVPTS